MSAEVNVMDPTLPTFHVGVVLSFVAPIVTPEDPKPGPAPASKASIEAMPTIQVKEIGKECAICLEEFVEGGEAREMPCKHAFHSGCIENWLGIHGSCPVCRFLMPVEERGDGGASVGGGPEGGAAALPFLLNLWRVLLNIGSDLRTDGGSTMSGSDAVDGSSTETEDSDGSRA